MVRCKEAVVDGDVVLPVVPANKATIVVTIGAVKTAVELTVDEVDTSTGEGNEAAVGGIAIHTAVERHSRVTVFDDNVRVFHYTGNETTCKLLAGTDGAFGMQTDESGIADIAEGSHVVLCNA